MTPPLPSQAGAPSCRAVLLCSSQVPPMRCPSTPTPWPGLQAPRPRAQLWGWGCRGAGCWVGSFCEVPLHGLCSDEQRGGYSYSRNCLW